MCLLSLFLFLSRIYLITNLLRSLLSDKGMAYLPGGVGWDFIMLLRTMHNVKLTNWLFLEFSI